jgi:hypothetical protein
MPDLLKLALQVWIANGLHNTKTHVQLYSL